jgi:AraC-like DNA-binding protein
MSLKKKSFGATHVRSAVLAHYLDVTTRLGFNPQSLLSKVGLNRSVLGTPDQQIPLSAAVDLLELTAQATQCETFGLLMAEMRQFSDLGPVSLLMTHQRTVRDAVNTTIQYRHLLNEGLAMHVEGLGKLTLVREEVVSAGSRSSRQANELAVGVLCYIFRALLGTQWNPQSANFIHTAPANPEVHKRIFRCKLQFEMDFNGLVCSTSDLDQPIPVADPVMARYAQSFIEAIPGGNSNSVLLEVRKSIYLLLPMGRASVEQIAPTLGMNVRTLQRRLGEDGETFSGLINAVRMELAQRYIANPKYPLGRIAELLGYSNHSAFTRWFIAQFRQTPQEMRLQNPSPLLR